MCLSIGNVRMPCSVGFLALAAGVSMMTAQAVADIRELEIGSPGSSDQQRVQSALLNNGWMVFVWEDQSGSDSDVLYRVFNPALSQLSVIRVAHVETTGDQVDPVVAPTTDGGFVIAFAGRPEGGEYDVFLRRFDFTGAAAGASDVLVNATTAGSQQHPSLTMLNNGTFVIAFSGPGANGQDLFFRRFDASGGALDALDREVNSLGADAVSAGDQGAVKVSAFPGGGWLTAFEDRESGNVYGVRFNNDGTVIPDPQGGVDEFYQILNEAVAHDQFEPSVAAFGDGQFAVAYNSDVDGTASGRRVFLRLFDAAGPASGDIQVGVAGQRSQDPDVSLLSNQRLLVAWKTLETTGAGEVWSVYAQEFELNGSPVGGPMFLHSDQSLNRGRPHVIPWMDGGFVVAWEVGAAGGSIAARTVAPLSSAPGLMSVLLSGPPQALVYQVSFLGFPGECYELQAADELNNWSTVLTTNAATGGFQFVDQDGSSVPQRFFRVKRVLSGL